MTPQQACNTGDLLKRADLKGIEVLAFGNLSAASGSMVADRNALKSILQAAL